MAEKNLDLGQAIIDATDKCLEQFPNNCLALSPKQWQRLFAHHNNDQEKLSVLQKASSGETLTMSLLSTRANDEGNNGLGFELNDLRKRVAVLIHILVFIESTKLQPNQVVMALSSMLSNAGVSSVGMNELAHYGFTMSHSLYSRQVGVHAFKTFYSSMCDKIERIARETINEESDELAYTYFAIWDKSRTVFISLVRT